MFNLRVNVYRGKQIESTHKIHAVVLDKQHKVIFSSGDPDYITCIRSSFKPFQAYPTIHYKGHLKYKLSNAEIALLCASHNGEPRHIKTAKKMLKKISVLPKQLECGRHLPNHNITRKQIIQNKNKLQTIHNNCSGKHIGMLATAKILKTTLKNYILPNHPIQKEIIQALYKNHSLKPLSLGIDGCGAPAPFFKIRDIAKIYMDFGEGIKAEYHTLYQAIVQHPYMIAGKGRFDSFFTQLMKGKGISKGGGEGVLGLYVKTKKYGPIALGLKVADGNHRARAIAVTHILHQIQALPKNKQRVLQQFCQTTRINHAHRKIGHISAETFKL